MPITPLDKFLKRCPRLTAAIVARRMARYLEAEPSSALMSRWRTGKHAPSPVEQDAMSAATCGEVTPGHWHRWRVRQERLAAGGRP